ncbi:MAG: cytochrome c maturation protein CcmE [Deltaproteobacteria bacterium]|nr:cytochrome c maturation protein CcmE [Deltaproteobacteria bacterium]
MNRSLKFVIGACLLVVAIGYLMAAGLQTSSTYYFTIAEFLPRQHELGEQPVRLAGRVHEGSLRKQTSAKGTEMTFTVGDFQGPGHETAPGQVPVAYTGVVPDMFAEGRDVIIEGKLVNGTLMAQSVMTSCPSKYEAKPGEGGPDAAQQEAQR